MPKLQCRIILCQIIHIKRCKMFLRLARKEVANFMKALAIHYELGLDE